MPLLQFLKLDPRNLIEISSWRCRCDNLKLSRNFTDVHSELRLVCRCPSHSESRFLRPGCCYFRGCILSPLSPPPLSPFVLGPLFRAIKRRSQSASRAKRRSHNSRRGAFCLSNRGDRLELREISFVPLMPLFHDA